MVIDPVAFRMFRPNSSFNSEVEKVIPRTDLTDEQLLICNPVLYEFLLSMKIWDASTLLRDLEGS